MDYEGYLDSKRTIFTILVVAAILFSSYPSNAEGQNEACFDGEPTVVKIIGKIYEKTFPGPPNYESVEKGDTPETQWILKLDNPICVAVTSQEESWIKWIIRDVREVTLVFLKKGIYKEEYLMYDRVVVTGTLWEANTGHHRTPILITVKEISKKKDTPTP